NSEAASHHVHVGFDHCLKCTKVSERYCALKREPLRAPGRANNARWCHLNPQILLTRVVIHLYLFSRIKTPLPVSLEVAGLGLADRMGTGRFCLTDAAYPFHNLGILYKTCPLVGLPPVGSCQAHLGSLISRLSILFRRDSWLHLRHCELSWSLQNEISKFL